MSRSLRNGVAIGVLVLSVIGVSTAASAQSASTTTELISVDSAEAQGNGDSDFPAISANGQLVAFQSPASNLVAGDTNNTFDAFLRDRSTGLTERISVSSSEVQGDLGGGSPDISADGRLVVFASRSTNLVSGDTNGVSDVFIRDRQTGETERLSLSTSGAQGDGFSNQAAISANGQFVAFQSAATNLVAGDGNGVVDVFVHDLVNDTTERVSVSTVGVEGDRVSDLAAISADGRFIAFQSEANNLAPGDTCSSQDIYLRDRQAGTTELITGRPTGQVGCGVLRPAISGDGRFVAFTSGSPDFVAGDTNAVQDVFVLDRNSGAFERVSVSSSGEQIPASGASTPGISADGRYVTFNTAATNLVSNDTNGAVDVFVHDRLDATTERVSVDSTGVEGNGHSLQSRGAPVSNDGRFIAFSSAATNLVAGDVNARVDVLLRDRGETAPPPPARFKYVALGDSFSSGEGVEPFFEPFNGCHRSELAYSTLVELPGLLDTSIFDLRQSGVPGIEWGFQACSGATTDDMLSTGQHADPLPQLALDRAIDVGNANDLPVDENTNLVTLTIGGNDMYFTKVLEFCWRDSACDTSRRLRIERFREKTVSAFVDARLVELSTRLDIVYQRIADQAPSARVLVLGYPQLFPASLPVTCVKLRQITFRNRTYGWSEAEQIFFRSQTNRVNDLIRTRAEAVGFEFVRVDSFFAGHEPCGADGEWVNGPTVDIRAMPNTQSFHPNECGHVAMAALVNLRLNARLEAVDC